MIGNKFVITIIFLLLLVGSVSAAQLSAKAVSQINNMSLKNTIDLNENVLTETQNSKVLINTNGVELTNKIDKSVIKSEIYIDDNKYSYTTKTTTDNKLVLQSGDTILKGVSKEPVEVTYEVNDISLKEKIVLQEDRDLKFNIIIPKGYILIPFYNGQYKIVSLTSGNTMEGTIIDRPFGIDASGRYIEMNYTYVDGKLNLNYDRYYFTYKLNNDKTDLIPIKNNIQYPLTIDPTWIFISAGHYNSSVSGYMLEVWNTSGTTTWTKPSSVSSVWYTVIAGGGGGGTYVLYDDNSGGGGGGAGGFANGTLSVAGDITVVVGAGGHGVASSNGSSGFLSSFGSISTTGGGGGGLGGANSGAGGTNGLSGGSGGGGGWAHSGGSGTSSQGFAGGSGSTGGYGGGGGGGSYIGSGTNATGGDGNISAITGSTIYYGGGGSGSSELYDGSLGGRDAGGYSTGLIGGSGYSWVGDYSYTTGGGGGGAGGSGNAGGAGGTGVVIIRYLLPIVAEFNGTPTSQFVNNDVQFVDMSGIIPTNWNWSFGDGSYSTTRNATHTYSSAGTFTVSLNASSPVGYNITTKTNYITITNRPLIGAFSGTPLSIGRNEIVQFTDGTTNGTPTAWSWTFGDSNSTNATSQNPIHAYLSTGTYTVSENVSNSAVYNITTKTNYVTVYDRPLILNFTGTPTTLPLNYPVSFTSSISNGTALTYAWTFGDGNSTNATLPNPVHTYLSTGTYTVSLTVNNTYTSNSTTKTNYITVTDGLPFSDFSANTTTGTSVLPVLFTPSTTRNITSWNWTFGAANFSTSQNPTYSFTGAGYYTIKLNASNPTYFNVTTKTNYINVTTAIINPNSYINISQSSIIVAHYGISIINVKNITASAIYANITFNKSAVNIISASNNYTIYPGLTVSPIYDNTNGFVSVNISNISGGPIIIGNTLTPLIDLNFTTLSYTNNSAPLNFASASDLLTTGGIENIYTKVPSIIYTTDSNFIYTVNLVDSSSGSKIRNLATVNVTGSNSSPSSQQTQNGVVSITSNYGYVNFTINAQGYYEYIQSVLVTGSNDLTFSLASYSGSSQTTWYSPHQVRITLIDNFNGDKLPGATINITALTNTFPTGSQSDYLISVYGINTQSANDMMNGTLIMSGVSDSDGSSVFTMLSSIGYNIHIVNDTAGIDHNIKIYPLENDYNIWITTLATTTPLYNSIANTSLTYTAPNSTYGTFGLTYQDLSGSTSQVIFNVTCVDNRTVMYSNTLNGFGTSIVYDSYTIKVKRGEQYTWSYNATRI
jgi:PKD repeat protein